MRQAKGTKPKLFEAPTTAIDANACDALVAAGRAVTNQWAQTTKVAAVGG